MGLVGSSFSSWIAAATAESPDSPAEDPVAGGAGGVTGAGAAKLAVDEDWVGRGAVVAAATEFVFSKAEMPGVTAEMLGATEGTLVAGADPPSAPERAGVATGTATDGGGAGRTLAASGAEDIAGGATETTLGAVLPFGGP